MKWFEGFEVRHFNVNGAQIYARDRPVCRATAPALLLLHGFAQTHAMWHRVAQLLQPDFYLVMPDLREQLPVHMFKSLERWRGRARRAPHTAQAQARP